MTTTIDQYARIAYDAYYAPIAPHMRNYFISELMMHPDEPPTQTALLDALDIDINDLIHNSNLSDLIPAADELDDDDYESLANFINDTRFTASIFNLLLDNASFSDMIAS